MESNKEILEELNKQEVDLKKKSNPSLLLSNKVINIFNKTFKNIKLEELDFIDGLYFLSDNGVEMQKGKYTEFITYTPLIPIKCFKNIDEDEVGDKVEIAFFQDKHWKSFIIEEAKLSMQNEMIKIFSSKGINVDVSNAKKVIEYLGKVKTKNRDLLPVDKISSTCGYKVVDNEEIFIPYSEKVLCDISKGTQEYEILKALKPYGNRDKVYNFIKKYLEKYDAVKLAISISFTSLLIHKLDIKPFLFNFWGTSGNGKTLLLGFVALPFGNPISTRGYIQVFTDSLPSIYSTANFNKNIPVIYDDSATLREGSRVKNLGEYFNNLIMIAGNGEEPARAMQDGKGRRIRSWESIFVTTGERPLLDNLSGQGSYNRCIEAYYPQDQIFEAEDYKILWESLAENYGYIGKEWVELLETFKKEDLKKQYNDLALILQKNYNTTAKTALLWASILLSDAILSAYYFETNSLDISYIEPFIKSKSEISEAERVAEAINDIVVSNPGQIVNFYSNEIDGIDETVYNSGKTSLLGRRDKDDLDCVYLISTSIKAELKKRGYNFDAVKEQLASLHYIDKYIEDNEKIRYDKLVRLIGSKGASRCIRFHLIKEEDI